MNLIIEAGDVEMVANLREQTTQCPPICWSVWGAWRGWEGWEAIL